MTLIKICGLTSVEDALNVARLDVDIIGLVFAPSSRRVSPEIAAQITAAVRKIGKRPAIAGVFVNENPQAVNETAKHSRLDIVQLSGDESWDYCRQIEFPVIKVVHVLRSTSAANIAARIAYSSRSNLKLPFICLLDSREGAYGGTGRAFDWEVARDVAGNFPVMIAGGLTPGNVGGLIASVKPLGVDVSSGVETDGRKDMAKVNSFIRAARSAAGPDVDNRSFLERFLLKGGKNVTR